MSNSSSPVLPPLKYDPPQNPLNILYQDDDLLVLSKPADLLSVPGRGPDLQDSLELRARAEFPEALLVHRLDMDTSGIFLMARNKAAQKALGLQFEKRETKKAYIALIHGMPEDDEGVVDLPLRCDWDNRPRQMVCYEHGKPSQTKWRVLERCDGFSRVLLQPITGRSHQLRVHMEALEKDKGGHAILGDPFYGEESSRNARDRLMLHAERLEITHPVNGKKIKFTDPAPF